MAKRSEIETSLRILAPRLPAHEFGAIVDHAVDSESLRPASAETGAWLSLVAYARHTFTEYDALLDQGYDYESARHFVAADIEIVLRRWGVKRPLQRDG